MLGGGGQGPSAFCVHEYYTIDRCAFETSDVGAWYTGGGGANAFVNRGCELRHSLFKNIFNTTKGGIFAGVSNHAVYLDDQISGWHVWNNTFYHCKSGAYIGGGEHNRLHDNYFQLVGKAVHLDNRGMGWQRLGGDPANCTKPGICLPGSPYVKLPTDQRCGCNTAAVRYLLHDSLNAASWRAAFGSEMEDSNRAPCLTATPGFGKGGAVPCFNVVQNNSFCKVGSFSDITDGSEILQPGDLAVWSSVMRDNHETACHFDREPPALKTDDNSAQN